MTPAEAANILGQTEDYVKRMQAKGLMPNPIPDDFLDPFIKARIKLEKVHHDKIDRSGGPTDG